MSAIPISVTIFQPSVAANLGAIQQAEALGVPQIWLPSAPAGIDPLPILAAAAVQTQRIDLGTAVLPTYPRHPLALGGEALALAALAPGRFRLGIGSSHPFIMEQMYGLSFGKPVQHLREYVTVLRSFLETSAVDFQGQYFQVHSRPMPGMEVEPQHIPILISALRAPMFRLAGEVADGALSAWCPVPYLLETALPAM